MAPFTDTPRQTVWYVPHNGVRYEVARLKPSGFSVRDAHGVPVGGELRDLLILSVGVVPKRCPDELGVVP